MEDGAELIGAVDCVEFQLACDSASSAAVSLSVRIRLVHRCVLARDLVFQPHPIIVEDALTFMSVHALYLEIDLLIDVVLVHPMYHWQQFGSQSELRLLNPQIVSNDDTGNRDGITAHQLMFVLLLGTLVLLVELPIRPKIIYSISSHGHHSSSAEEHIMRVQA